MILLLSVLIVTLIIVFLVSILKKMGKSAASQTTILQSTQKTIFGMPEYVIVLAVGIWGIFTTNVIPFLCDSISVGCHASEQPWYGYIVSIVGILSMFRK